MTSTPVARRLRAESVTVGYGADPVVRDLSLDVPDGQVTTIVGPNGCGKSTLLRTMARLLKPDQRAGAARRPVRSTTCPPARSPGGWRCCRRARSPPTASLVRDLVGRGRHPHQRWFSQWSPDDERIVESALEMTDTADLRDRPLDQLSGGQRQRAWIAMTLAQDTDLMLLDEPTTYLDLAHQVEVLDLVTRLNRERGRTVVMVLHDLNLAARYSDRIVVMKDGVDRHRGHAGRGLHARPARPDASASTPTSSPTRGPVCRSSSPARPPTRRN